MISILAMIYRRQQAVLGLTSLSDLHFQAAKSALAASVTVLRHCGVINRRAQQYWQTLDYFKRSCEGILGERS